MTLRISCGPPSLAPASPAVSARWAACPHASLKSCCSRQRDEAARLHRVGVCSTNAHSTSRFHQHRKPGMNRARPFAQPFDLEKVRSRGDEPRAFDIPERPWQRPLSIVHLSRAIRLVRPTNRVVSAGVKSCGSDYERSRLRKQRVGLNRGFHRVWGFYAGWCLKDMRREAPEVGCRGCGCVRRWTRAARVRREVDELRNVVSEADGGCSWSQDGGGKGTSTRVTALW
jgi:hypothetical protein